VQTIGHHSHNTNKKQEARKQKKIERSTVCLP
jgi:hypothetical protein